MRPITILWILPLLAACGQDPIARLQARQAAADPPQLWSVAVEGAGARPGDKPIEICTDRLIRTGFLNQGAVAGDIPCLPERPPVTTPTSVSMRCRMGEETYAVYNAAEGDQGSDYHVRFSMQSLGGNAVALSQVRHYRYLGPCPAGWQIGDATDRYGRPASNAMR